MLIGALVENLMRADLVPAETATAVAKLRELTGWFYEVIAEHMGLTPQRVRDLAAVARHEVVRDAVRNGEIAQRQATILLVMRAITRQRQHSFPPVVVAM